MALVDIEIDQLIPQSLQAILGGGQFIETLLDDIAQGAWVKWKRLAQTRLETSREEYVAGIQRPEVRPGERIIALVGWLPQAVEEGLSSFDMRDTLLKEGAKVSAAGKRYRPIPFSHAGPGAKTSRAGTAVGSRMGPTAEHSLAQPGALAAVDAKKLGRRVWRAAKRAASQGKPLGPGAGGVQKLAAHHATDIYAGMRQGGAPGHEGMKTFRTISEANPEGWLHPGIQARNLLGEVEEFARGLVVPALQAAIQGALSELGK